MSFKVYVKAHNNKDMKPVSWKDNIVLSDDDIKCMGMIYIGEFDNYCHASNYCGSNKFYEFSYMNHLGAISPYWYSYYYDKNGNGIICYEYCTMV